MHAIISLLFFYHTAGWLLKGNFVHLCGLVRTCLWRDFGRLDWCVWCVPCAVCCGFRANVRYIRGRMHRSIHWTAWRMRHVTRIFLYHPGRLQKPGRCLKDMRRAGRRHWTTWAFVHSCGWISSMQPVCSERRRKPKGVGNQQQRDWATGGRCGDDEDLSAYFHEQGVLRLS